MSNYFQTEIPTESNCLCFINQETQVYKSLIYQVLSLCWNLSLVKIEGKLISAQGWTTFIYSINTVQDLIILETEEVMIMKCTHFYIEKNCRREVLK